MICFDGGDVRLILIEEIKALGLPLFMCGAGTYCEYLLKYLRLNGITEEIKFVVDDEYKKDNDGLMTFSEYLREHADNSVMIIAFFDYTIARKKLEQYKTIIPHIYDFRINCVQDRLLIWDKAEAQQRLTAYEETYSMLADDKSRRTMELYLRAAVNGEFNNLFDECYENTAYFNSVTEKIQIDVLVDCGAFDGDDIYDFVKVFPLYKMIYAFEPDLDNVSKMQRNMSKDGIRNVKIINKGVFSESTVLKFSSNEGVASHLSGEGDVLVPVVTLDEVPLDNCTGNLLIKMDIEGSEMDALRGVAETIRMKHPCLTICVYHKEEDLITIPQYIDSLVETGTYDYYLRFHGFSLSELVFYAIPHENNQVM